MDDKEKEALKKEDKQEEKQEEKHPISMIIEMSPEGQIKVTFPFLKDKIATYGFLKLAEKTLDKFYREIEQTQLKQLNKLSFKSFIKNLH